MKELINPLNIKTRLNSLDKDNVEYKPVVPGVAFAPEEATVELPW